MTDTIKPRFQFEDAMFLPFKIGAEGKKFVLKSAGIFTLAMIAIAVLFSGKIQAANADYQWAVLAGGETSAAFVTLMATNLPITFLTWALWAVVEAAFYRRALRPSDNGATWRFGKDEMRVMLCQFVAVSVSALIFAVPMLLLLATAETGEGGMISSLFTIPVVIFSPIMALYAAARLVPAAAVSVAENRFGLRSAWRLTKGRARYAFGASALILIAGMIVYMVLATLLMLGLYGTEIFEFWVVSMTGDVEKTLALSEELFGENGISFRSILMTGLGNFYSALLGLCMAGVGTYMYRLYGTPGDVAVEGPSVP